MGARNEEDEGCRTDPPGYIGWRNRSFGNRFLGSLNVYKLGLSKRTVQEIGKEGRRTGAYCTLYSEPKEKSLAAGERMLCL